MVEFTFGKKKAEAASKAKWRMNSLRLQLKDTGVVQFLRCLVMSIYDGSELDLANDISTFVGRARLAVAR